MELVSKAFKESLTIQQQQVIIKQYMYCLTVTMSVGFKNQN